MVISVGTFVVINHEGRGLLLFCTCKHGWQLHWLVGTAICSYVVPRPYKSAMIYDIHARVCAIHMTKMLQCSDDNY